MVLLRNNQETSKMYSFVVNVTQLLLIELYIKQHVAPKYRD